MKSSRILASITLPILIFVGCGQKDSKVVNSFNPSDYAVLKEMRGYASASFTLNEYIDETLGLKEHTWMKFIGENSPYDQIILECTHRGVFKINPFNSYYDRFDKVFTKSKKLSECIKSAANNPVSVETILYNPITSLHWQVEKEDQQIRLMIIKAKEDNQLSVEEFIKIGSAAEQNLRNKDNKNVGDEIPLSTQTSNPLKVNVANKFF